MNATRKRKNKALGKYISALVEHKRKIGERYYGGDSGAIWVWNQSVVFNSTWKIKGGRSLCHKS
jgi:hypothetical protein